MEKTLREIAGKKAEGYLCVINWGEIYYTIMREQGQTVAEEIVEVLSHYPLQLVEADQQLTKAAAKLKGKHRIAHADCFAAALAIERQAVVLTGDPDFKLLEKEVSITWLG